jgi:tRNA-modifying protein YgfZ
MTSSPITASSTSSMHGVARLTEWGVISAQGLEAAKFLHGQLTQDFSLLGLSEARLSAFCSAKGRMLASFVGFKRSHDEILLVCSRDILPAALKRLSMFVLRAKVRLSDVSESFGVWGIAGGDDQGLPEKVWSKTGETDGAQWVRLYPAQGVSRALCVAPLDPDGAAWAPAGEALDPGVWAWLEVMSGVATITQPLVEAFVPQMLNYESVGGVNFKKGCYPGQEVVARSQFRGTLKRRAYIVQAPAALAVGQEVFHHSDPEQPCGLVAAAAANPAGGWNAIVSMQTRAAEGGQISVGSADGQTLTLLPLPYPLLDDI